MLDRGRYRAALLSAATWATPQRVRKLTEEKEADVTYPINVTRTPTGAYSATVTGLPSVIATAWTMSEAVQHASEQALTLLNLLMLTGEALPMPSTGSEPTLELDSNVSAKCRLYEAMRKANLSRSKLAELAGMDRAQIDELLNLRFRSTPERIGLAMASIVTAHDRSAGMA